MSLLALALGWCAWLAGAPATQSDQPVLFVELVAEGPLDAVIVEESADAPSATRIAGPLRAGERRTLVLAVPVRAPWRAGPDARLPVARALGAGPGASARVVAARDPQPAERLEQLSPGLRGRPSPAPPELATRPAWAGLAAVVLTLCVSLAVRKRPLALAATSLGGALACWAATVSAAAWPAGVRVLEVELPLGACCEVRAARDELALGFDGLSVEPAGTPLSIDSGFDGTGRVRAGGALLVARRVVAAQGPLERAGNGWGALAAAWVRDAGGRWSFHGPWPLASPLPAERAGPAVPGWLAAGVPPGVGVLVGALDVPDGPDENGDGWLRAVGFEAR